MAKRLKLPNGFGSIYKLTGNRRKKYAAIFPAKLNENGKYSRKVLGYFNSYNDAYNALIKNSETPINSDNLKIYNFEYLLNKFIEEKTGEIKEKTLNRYIKAMVNFKSLNNYEIKDIKYEVLQNILNSLPNATGKSALVVLNYIYNEALKLEVTSKNIASFLKASKIKTKIVTRRVYSLNDINSLYTDSTVLDDVFLDILVVLLYTGLRGSEALEIETEKVFLDKRYFITGKKTESGKNRIIPIHKKIHTLIEKHYNLAKTHNYKYLFFNNGKNIIIDNYKYYFYKIMRKYGMNYNIHSTRYSFITQMRELEVNDSKLKRIIGHKVNDITELYTHYSVESLIKLIDVFEYK